MLLKIYYILVLFAIDVVQTESFYLNKINNPIMCKKSSSLFASGSNSPFNVYNSALLKFDSNKSNLISISACFLASIFLIVNPATASNDYNTFFNERYQTSFNYPKGWEEKNGELSGGRIVEAFVNPQDKDTSVSVVISPIPADYTRLESFGGGKETLREYVLPKGEGVTASVVQESVKGNAYYLEYVVSAPDVVTRHVLSVFALRPQESVVGLTIQTPESNYENRKEELGIILPSFKFQ